MEEDLPENLKKMVDEISEIADKYGYPELLIDYSEYYQLLTIDVIL